MRLFEETDRRFAGIQKKIGLFVVFALVGVVAVAVFVGVQQDYFTPKIDVYFVTQSGQDISPGMPVKLSGFVIGKVKSSSLDDIARVRVELSINKQYMKWVRTDSKAKLVKEGLIGEGVIEIIPGTEKASEMKDGEIIAFERETGLGEMAGELKDEIKPLLADIRQIVHYANNDPKGNIKRTLANLSRLSDGRLGTRENLDGLIGSIGSDVNGIAMKLDETLSSVQKTVGDLNAVIKQVGGDFGGAMVKVNNSLDNVQKATEELKKAVEQAAPQVPELVKTGSEAAKGAKEVIDSVKGVWPISSGVEESREKTLKVDSVEK